MRFPIPLLLLALLVSGCAKHSSEAFAWGDDWDVKNSAQADGFFDGLKTKLASEGLILSEPMTGFVAGAGQQPSEGDQVYWFKGSYQGSPVFYLKLVRDGPHLECFHMMYFWDVVAYTSPQKEMEDKTHSFHEMLTDWAANGKLVYLPPGST